MKFPDLIRPDKDLDEHTERLKTKKPKPDNMDKYASLPLEVVFEDVYLDELEIFDEIPHHRKRVIVVFEYKTRVYTHTYRLIEEGELASMTLEQHNHKDASPEDLTTLANMIQSFYESSDKEIKIKQIYNNLRTIMKLPEITRSMADLRDDIRKLFIENLGMIDNTMVELSDITIKDLAHTNLPIEKIENFSYVRE